MKKTMIYSVLVLVILGLGVWWALGKNEANKNTDGTPTSADNAPPGSIHNLPVPSAVSAVRSQVAQELGLSEGLVIIQTAFEREWSDGCLGLGGPAESCLQALVSGYIVTVEAKGETRVYRTNADGTSIRREK